MKHNYTADQHREYILMTRRTGELWRTVIAGNDEFYATHYWELFTGMWFQTKPMMVSDALKLMISIKSPFTARKYLQKAIEAKLVVERKNPKDERSILVELSADLRKKLDTFFDRAIDNLLDTAKSLS